MLLLDRLKGVNTEMRLMDNTLGRLNTKFLKFNETFKLLSNQIFTTGNAFGRIENSMQASALASQSLSSGLGRVSTNLKIVKDEARLAAASLAEMRKVSRVSSATVTPMVRSGSASKKDADFHIPHQAFNQIGLHETGKVNGALVAAERAGGPLLLTGLGVGIGARKGYESSMEYDKLMNQLQALGLNDQQMQMARSMTQQQIPGISYISQAQALVDAQMATRDTKSAMALAPELAKVKYIAGSIYSGLGEDQIKSAVRIAELRGGINPKDIGQELQEVIHMYNVTGGTINPTDYLALFRRFTEASQISPEALMALEPVMQEIKPVTVGTALKTLKGKLLGGVKLREQDVDFFNQIGLFKGDKIKSSYAKTLSTDPEAFFTKVWFPLLKKAGITTPEGIEQADLMLGRTPSNLAASILKNAAKDQLSREQYKKLLTTDQLYQMSLGSQAGSALKLSESFSNLATAFGEFSKPGTIAGMNMLANYIDHLSEIFKFLSKTTIVPSKSDFKSVWGAMTFQNVDTSKISFKSLWDWATRKSVPEPKHTMRSFPRPSMSPKSLTIDPSQYEALAHTPGIGAKFSDVQTPPKSDHSTGKKGDVILDKRKVGEVVWDMLNEQISRGGTQPGISGFDPAVTLPSTGTTFYGGAG
ncbi:MAG TPA: hypothetical protein PKX08_15760, partial [Cyclobacteriaceae bacterium]|nr:hypothetical protein [Cyclobacteriaceae bacterium]